MPVGRFEQMFLGARAKGLKSATEWATDAWQTLSKQGQAIIKDGEVLQGAEANLRELDSQVQALSGKRLALLQRLQVAD